MRHNKNWISGCKAAWQAGLCTALVLLAAPAALATDAGTAPPKAADYASAHISALSTLKKIASTHSAVTDAIARDDFKKVEQLHGDAQAKIAQVRRSLDMAYLRGAWNNTAAKKQAADVRSRFEGVEILNFIVMAMLTGYQYPTKHVPASVKETNTRMFEQLDTVIAQIQNLNATVAQSARPGEKLGQRGQ